MPVEEAAGSSAPAAAAAAAVDASPRSASPPHSVPVDGVADPLATDAKERPNSSAVALSSDDADSDGEGGTLPPLTPYLARTDSLLRSFVPQVHPCIVWRWPAWVALANVLLQAFTVVMDVRDVVGPNPVVDTPLGRIVVLAQAWGFTYALLLAALYLRGRVPTSVREIVPEQVLWNPRHSAKLELSARRWLIGCVTLGFLVVVMAWTSTIPITAAGVDAGDMLSASGVNYNGSPLAPLWWRGRPWATLLFTFSVVLLVPAMVVPIVVVGIATAALRGQLDMFGEAVTSGDASLGRFGDGDPYTASSRNLKSAAPGALRDAFVVYVRQPMDAVSESVHAVFVLSVFFQSTVTGVVLLAVAGLFQPGEAAATDATFAEVISSLAQNAVTALVVSFTYIAVAARVHAAAVKLLVVVGKCAADPLVELRANVRTGRPPGRGRAARVAVHERGAGDTDVVALSTASNTRRRRRHDVAATPTGRQTGRSGRAVGPETADSGGLDDTAAIEARRAQLAALEVAIAAATPYLGLRLFGQRRLTTDLVVQAVSLYASVLLVWVRL